VRISTMHLICRSHTGTWRPVAGRDRAATCHPVDRCTIKEMSDDKYLPQIPAPDLVAFLETSAPTNFEVGMTPPHLNGSLRSPSKGPFSLFVTRRLDFAAVRRGADRS